MKCQNVYLMAFDGDNFDFAVNPYEGMIIMKSCTSLEGYEPLPKPPGKPRHL